jgi:hypothetical protein
MRMFSGPRGLASAGKSAYINWTLKPRPPRCFHTNSSGNGEKFCVPALKSMSRILPKKDMVSVYFIGIRKNV